jgi:hypothetical protein
MAFPNVGGIVGKYHNLMKNELEPIKKTLEELKQNDTKRLELLDNILTRIKVIEKAVGIEQKT